MVSARSLMRASPIGFALRRRRYNARLRPDAQRTPDPRVTREVLERGICLVERHVVDVQLSALRREVLRELPSPTADGNVFLDIDPAADGMEALRTLSSSAFLQCTMDAVAGSPTQLFGVRAQIRNPSSTIPTIDLWHTDTWHIRLKAMLFLDDVTIGSGPMTYAAGTHRRSVMHPARWTYDYLRDVRSAPWPRLAAQIARKGEHLMCTGPAGTMAIFDTRGFHTANTPTTHPRFTLTFSFALVSDIPS